MDTGLATALLVLALIDSTSFGTLLIPVWLMLAPGRPRVSRLLVFLGTVAAVYFALGVALLSGASLLLDRADAALDSQPARIAQLVLGAGLLAGGVLVGSRRGGRAPLQPLRRRRAAISRDRSLAATAGLGLAAAVVEAATMVPYLAAVGLLSASSLAGPATISVLAAYCAVMVLPALVLLAGRVLAAGAIQPALERVEGWVGRNAREGVAWVAGVTGFLLAHDAAGRLGLL